MTLRDAFAQGLVRAAKRIAPQGRPIAIPPHLLTPPQPSAPTGLPKDAVQTTMQTAQAPQAAATTAFPPGSPLAPAPGAVSPLGPRQFNYPVGYNVAQLPRGTEGTSYATLRQLAASYEGIRMCERVWFDVLARLRVKVGFLPNIIPDGESEQDPKWRKIAQPAEDFFNKPDGRLPLSQWLVASAKDVLELGLSVIYLNRNRAGDIIGLELVDAATVKPLIDERGRQPAPPYPAYQQFVYGVPGGQYTALEMIDITEMSRTDSSYPTSRVEDVLLRVNLALRKSTLDLTRFTDGAVPEGLLRLATGAQMTATEQEEYEQRLNGQLSGNDQLKVRLKILPPDIEEFIAARQADPNLDLDKFILNLTAGEFGVTMDEISMTQSSNRSVGESQQNVIYRRVVQPLGSRYTDFFTLIAQLTFDPRLLITWDGMDEAEDRLAKAQEMDIGVKNGALSPSDMAHAMGWPVKQEVPSFVIAQGGAEGIVLLDTLDAIRDNNLQSMQAKLAATQAATHISEDQGQELDQQVQQSQAQNDLGDESTASPEDNETAPTADESDSDAADDGSADDAEKAVDGLIAQAKAKASSPQRAVASIDAVAVGEEWRRYREVALRAVKRGKAIPAFTSDILPIDEHAWVADQLMTCATVDEVRGVFLTQRERSIAEVGLTRSNDDNTANRLTSDVPQHTGVMVALMLPGAIAQQIALPGGEPAQDLHITLAYLGDTTKNTINQDALLATVKTWAAQQHPLYVDIDDLDRFPGNADDGSPVILHAYADDLHRMRADLMTCLDAAHVTDFAQTFPVYTPHVTLAYIPPDAPLPDVTMPSQHPCFTAVTVCIGDARSAFPLGPSPDEERAKTLDTEIAAMRQLRATIAAELTRMYDEDLHPRGPGGKWLPVPKGVTAADGNHPATYRPSPDEPAFNFRTSAAFKDYLANPQKYESSPERGDPLFAALAKERGLDAPPHQVTKAEMDQLVRGRKGETEMWRGEARAAYADQFLHGDWHVGLGVDANGTYAAVGRKGRQTVSYFATGALMRMSVKADARVIHVDQIRGMVAPLAQEMSDKYTHAMATQNAEERAWYGGVLHVLQDPGRAAMLYGYDAIQGYTNYHSMEGEDTSMPEIVVLNRSAVRVQVPITTYE